MYCLVIQIYKVKTFDITGFGIDGSKMHTLYTFSVLGTPSGTRALKFSVPGNLVVWQA